MFNKTKKNTNDKFKKVIIKNINCIDEKNNNLKDYKQILTKRILFENKIPFKNYEVNYNSLTKKINVGCNFLDYDLKDNIINRKMELNRINTFKLVLVLIKYIFIGRI